MHKMLITLAAVIALTIAPVQAQSDDTLPSAGLLPGNPLYFLDSWGESIQQLFAGSDSKKAELFVGQAEERLAEAKTLAEREGTEHIQDALEGYQAKLDEALARAEAAKERGEQAADDVLARVSEATLKHQVVLAAVYDRVPDAAKTAIEQAMTRSLNGYEEATNALSAERRQELETRTEDARQQVEERLKAVRERAGAVIPEFPGSAGAANDGATDAAESSAESNETTSRGGGRVLDEACVTRIAGGQTADVNPLTADEEERIRRECFSQ